LAAVSVANWLAPVDVAVAGLAGAILLAAGAGAGAGGAAAGVGAAGFGAAAAGAAGLGGAAAGVFSASGFAAAPRHFSTYDFSVILAAWFAALLACHSSLQAFSVFC